MSSQLISVPKLLFMCQWQSHESSVEAGVPWYTCHSALGIGLACWRFPFHCLVMIQWSSMGTSFNGVCICSLTHWLNATSLEIDNAVVLVFSCYLKRLLAFRVVPLVGRVDRALELFSAVFLLMVIHICQPVSRQNQHTLCLYCILK